MACCPANTSGGHLRWAWCTANWVRAPRRHTWLLLVQRCNTNQRYPRRCIGQLRRSQCHPGPLPAATANALHDRANVCCLIQRHRIWRHARTGVRMLQATDTHLLLPHSHKVLGGDSLHTAGRSCNHQNWVLDTANSEINISCSAGWPAVTAWDLSGACSVKVTCGLC